MKADSKYLNLFSSKLDTFKHNKVVTNDEYLPHKKSLF